MNQEEDSTREPESLVARQEFMDEPSRQSSPDTSSPMELKLDSVTISTPSKKLIEDASETIAAGRITLIVGPSGAGKSVLLRTLAGLLPQSGESLSWTGEIQLSNDSGTRLNPKGNVGVVFQQFALFDELSCTANIQFAIDHRSTGKRSKRTNSAYQNKSATQWLDQLGVPANVPVGNLSGGQKQRLAIARTLARSPDIILYDEPTSGLDAASGSKVAELIRETHRLAGRTSVIVTHDYPTLIPIADDILLFNTQTKKLERLEHEQWKQVPERLQALTSPSSSPKPKNENPLTQFVSKVLDTTGAAVGTALILPLRMVPLFPRWKWGTRFIAHYLRLIAGPSAWVYLLVAGLIIGFTSTFFTFRFLPFRLYTQPLLIDELLASVGFALYRILVPILATILIAARCGAAVTADVGVKRYGGQTDALSTMGLSSHAYLLTPILLAFAIATPLLEWLAFAAAKATSLLTFLSSHPQIGAHFWDQHFHARISANHSDAFWPEGWQWVLSKNLLCGIGTAAIAYYKGFREKNSASDVSSSVTSTVLWATLYVLTVHFAIALFEF